MAARVQQLERVARSDPHPAQAPAQRPGVVYDGTSRFLARSYAKVHRGDLSLPQGTL